MRTLLAVLAMTTVVALIPGCSNRDEANNSLSSEAMKKPGTPIILVTVDTLRPDHLPLYGYDEPTAPALDHLAQSSVVFDLAFSTAPKTAPAYATMFTGAYPYRHGVRLLGQELHADNVTLAERLAEAGYATGGFVSSTVMINRLSALGKGFGIWDDYMPRREPNRENYERGARQTMNAALEWLPDGSGPFFLFIHLIDPHGPYVAPAMFRTRYSKRQGDFIDPEDVPGFQRLQGAEVIGDYIDGYDGEVTYADFELGRLLTELMNRELYDRALIVFTADHGESFGEDGFYFRHGKTLHEVSIRVPLVIKPPGGRPVGVPERRGGTVSLVDIAPTLLDYAGVAIPEGLDGVSLRAVVEGGDQRAERFVFSERWLPGRRSWAIHSERGTLRAEDCPDAAASRLEDCRETYMGRLGTAKLVEIERETEARAGLRSELASFVDRAASYSLPFTVLWRYRPKDRDFVETFVADHNLRVQSYDGPDTENLEKLGYLED